MRFVFPVSNVAEMSYSTLCPSNHLICFSFNHIINALRRVLLEKEFCEDHVGEKDED